MTFAVIRTGGKQYKVAADDVLKIEKLDAEPGTIVTFNEVLMVGDVVGAPLVEGALVAAELVETRKQKTVIVFKKKRRHNYRRRNGHRQLLSTVRITEILTGGKAPSLSVSAKPEAAAEAPAKPKKAKAAKADAPPAPAEGFVDDVTLIGGVGPALEKKLAANGVTSLAQIAAWTAEDVAKFDELLSFKGRIERDEWIAQAQDLIAGKPPRAKIDQDAAKADKE